MSNSGTKKNQGRKTALLSVSDIPKPILERLTQYHQIALRAGEDGNENLSSGFLSGILDVDETLVRKDMAAVGIVGKPRVGYSTGQIIRKLEETMGLSQNTDAVLIGCGGIGSALLRYPGFRKYGLRIAAAFDADYQKVNQRIGDYVILPMEKCRSVIKTFQVKVAILAVPAGVAQETVDWLVQRGIRAIWNFAPIHLNAPDNVIIRNENLALGLAELIHHLKRKNPEGGDGATTD